MEEKDITDFPSYWSVRSDTYSATVMDDINEGLADNWISLVRARLPKGRLKILDVGTGPGFFPMMLGKDHDVTGIDFSEGMLEKAAANTRSKGVECRLLKMNAEELDFEPESFDAVVSRNVFWNLPHPEKAYDGIMKVLKKGGKMFIFDGCYNTNQNRDAEVKDEDAVKKNPYLRYKLSDAMMEKYRMLAEGLPMSNVSRPEWDMSVLRSKGISSFEVVFSDNLNFYPNDKDRIDTYYFMICAVKKE